MKRTIEKIVEYNDPVLIKSSPGTGPHPLVSAHSAVAPANAPTAEESVNDQGPVGEPAGEPAQADAADDIAFEEADVAAAPVEVAADAADDAAGTFAKGTPHPNSGLVSGPGGRDPHSLPASPFGEDLSNQSTPPAASAAGPSLVDLSTPPPPSPSFDELYNEALERERQLKRPRGPGN